MMAATLGCNTARVLYNATGTRSTSGEPSTSSLSRLHLRGKKKLPSLKLAGGGQLSLVTVRASSSEGDKVREISSEKSVESNQQIAQDVKKLGADFDAKADDAADAASYEGIVREKAVDVASDMAVDNSADVDALAMKDAEPLADEFGRSVEDAAAWLGAKAAEISEREARKESGSGNSESSSFFRDQVIKEKVLDVASDSAVDGGADVDATASADAADMTSKIGGDERRNKVTIQNMADTASNLETDRSGSDVEAGAKKSLEEGKQKLEGLSRTISKNLKDGIDASRPSLEELSRTASKGVKAGQENLDYAAEGAAELLSGSGDVGPVLDGAKGALEKRLSVINLAAEDARETGKLVEQLAAKGWDALTKTTERLVGNFKKNAGEIQTTAEQKAQEAKVKAQETAEQAQSKLSEAKENVQAKTQELKQNAEATAERAQSKFGEAKEDVQSKTGELRDAAQEKADQAQSKFNEAKDTAQTKTEELKDTAQEKASESRSKLSETADQAQGKLGEAKENVQSKTSDLRNTAQEKADQAQDKLGEAKDNMQSKSGNLKNSAQEKASELDDVKENVSKSKAGSEKDSFTKAVDTMKDVTTQGTSSSGSSVIGQTPGGVIGQTPGPNTGSGNGNGKSNVIGQTPSGWKSQ